MKGEAMSAENDESQVIPQTSFAPQQPVFVVNDDDYRGYSPGTVQEVSSQWKVTAKGGKWITRVKVTFKLLTSPNTPAYYYTRTKTKIYTYKDADKYLSTCEEELAAKSVKLDLEQEYEKLDRAKKTIRNVQDRIREKEKKLAELNAVLKSLGKRQRRVRAKKATVNGGEEAQEDKKGRFSNIDLS